ncbi:cAMP-responsive element modulator-like isoform X2 [Hypomesus transpacificus]|uniref:cAMP-responsive element modulator-like isoform X2 n=1 Tax=Hypomesus transpacificus TaxID=137520 RepID=UPI001F071E3A|nr:cAMP-responsive element modulator-like isoform X2 [Hypomesus transpacificus]
MTMEMVSSRQDGSVSDDMSDDEGSQSDTSSTTPAHSQVTVSSGTLGDSTGVTLVQLADGQTIQLQGVIQAPQASVIQPPQTSTGGGLEDGEPDTIDTQKRREILSRRPSYRKILNELSSDSPAVARIEEEKAEEEAAAASLASAPVPTSIYQTSSGQYIAITQGGAIQLASPGNVGLQGGQTLTMSSSATPQAGATILQYATQPGDSPQQFYMQGGQVVIQAATGDMPAYQLRSPSSGLPQGLVMASSPGSLHSPPVHTEEVTRKREVRLMKNREAARECRRKKKEYVKCLENRVAVLENQNKTLIEELKALKDIYCHKTE